jgi:hypothetical protein
VGMKKNVVVCDFTDVSPGGLKRPCQRLADGECTLCHADGCEEHLGFGLTVSVFNTTPPQPSPDPSRPKQAYQTYKTETSVRICRACSDYSCGRHLSIDMEPHLKAARDGILQEIRAYRAAEDLKTK